MIFELQQSLQGETVMVASNIDDAWDMRDMLAATYPNDQFYIVHWGQYENGVVFPK